MPNPAMELMPLWRSGRKGAPARMLQFLVALLKTDPLIWRRIQVPEAYTFGTCMSQSKMRWDGRIVIFMNSESNIRCEARPSGSGFRIRGFRRSGRVEPVGRCLSQSISVVTHRRRQRQPGTCTTLATSGIIS
jgi:hypothetical protein